MATISALITTIISDLARSDPSLSDIVLIDVKSSIRDYEAHRFYFNERKLSITLSATNTYALSLFVATDGTLGDIIEIDKVSVLVSGGVRRYTLDETDYGTMRDNDYGPGAPAGNPGRYAIYNQSLIIDTFPNQVITGTIDCHVKFVDPITTASDNPWSNDASELIRNATLKRLWGRRFRDDSAAQAVAIGEQLALAALQRRTDALSGGTIPGYL